MVEVEARRRGISPGRWILLALAGLAAAGCSDPSGPAGPAGLAPAEGQSVTAAVGSAHTIGVLVTDSRGSPVSGVTVQWGVATGGGTANPASSITNGSGRANTVWQLGTSPGAHSLTATVEGLPPLGFTATATPGPPGGVSPHVQTAASAPAGSLVSPSPAVIVRDSHDNPVPGVPVEFEVTAGGGSVTGPVPVTGADGIAAVGGWALGTVAGEQSLGATIPGLSPIYFNILATAGPPAEATAHGDPPIAPGPGSAVTPPPSVRVRDAHGNPVPGVSVQFTVTSGGGSLTEASQSSDPAGIATVGGWTVGPAAGVNTLAATVQELDQVTFTVDVSTPPPSLDVIVDSIRVAFGLPALGGAIVTLDDPDFARGVAGVREVGFSTPVTAHDRWHLGSNFKAFTGVLGAIAVDDGALNWSRTLADEFSALEVSEPYRSVTFIDLLSMRSRLQRDPGSYSGSTRTEQRLSVTAWGVAQQPASAAGEYFYANTAYMVAASMIERALGGTFEEHMQSRVFQPLGILDAGFGPQDPPGSAQPVSHRWQNGGWLARPNFDNPPVYSSAGGVHMSLGSWARFIQEVLRIGFGESTIVSPEAGRYTTTAHTTVSSSTSYGLGWAITTRNWAGGKTLYHSGSNTANTSVTWVAPLHGFAVIAVTNSSDFHDGGGRSSGALDALAGRLIRYYETGN
jgi:CubicO group peptidase (beta-lactamase class C family)